jgi:hypothetical protein
MKKRIWIKVSSESHYAMPLELKDIKEMGDMKAKAGTYGDVASQEIRNTHWRDERPPPVEDDEQ